MAKITKSVTLRRDGFFTFTTGKPFDAADTTFINNVKPNSTVTITLADQDDQGRFRRLMGSVGGYEKLNTF